MVSRTVVFMFAVAIVVFWASVGVEAQVSAVADEYMLVTSVEFMDAKGGSGPTATCESRLGRATGAVKTVKVKDTLDDGGVVDLELMMPKCTRLSVLQGYWVVASSIRATVKVRSGDQLRILGWAQEATHSVPINGRVLVGTIELTPGGTRSHSMAIYLGLRLLEEAGN